MSLNIHSFIHSVGNAIMSRLTSAQNSNAHLYYGHPTPPLSVNDRPRSGRHRVGQPPPLKMMHPGVSSLKSNHNNNHSDTNTWIQHILFMVIWRRAYDKRPLGERERERERERARCHHYMGYSFQLAAMDILYALSHRQDSTYHGL